LRFSNPFSIARDTFLPCCRKTSSAYPNARILYASEKDFSTANRVRFFNNIKNNDYD